MAASQATQAEIRSGTQDLPPLFSAGMFFFHGENVIELNVHHYPLLLTLDAVPVLLGGLFQFVGAVFIVGLSR